jgi:hypothetical protein
MEGEGMPEEEGRGNYLTGREEAVIIYYIVIVVLWDGTARQLAWQVGCLGYPILQESPFFEGN